MVKEKGEKIQSVTGKEGGREEAPRSHSGGKIKADVEITKTAQMGAHISELQPSPSLLCFGGGYTNQNRRYKSSASDIGFCGQSERPN